MITILEISTEGSNNKMNDKQTSKEIKKPSDFILDKSYKKETAELEEAVKNEPPPPPKKED
jgi:hypothetical protein